MLGGFFGHLRQWSEYFVSLRESSVAFGNLPKKSGIVVKWPKTPWCTKENIIGLFWAVFASFWKKITVSKNLLLLVLKCLKFNCFMLQSQKMKCLLLSRYPPPPQFRPSDEKKIPKTESFLVIFLYKHFNKLKWCDHKVRLATTTKTSLKRVKWRCLKLYRAYFGIEY